MFPTLGHRLLLLALVAAIYVVAVTALAFRRTEKRPVLLASAHNATLAVWGLVTAASLVLVYLFLSDDFSVNYVWNNSARAQPTIYKIAAFWGGQAGSLLMWAWMLATYSIAVAFVGRRMRQEIAPTAVAVITAVNLFFIGMVVFVASPFALVEGKVAEDGFGLNPLLQNYWMQIHPPTLYVGYVGCTVPFAYAVAALLHHQFDANWAAIVRRWALFSWIVLGTGIVMGGVWAYETLGWGGYWAWDPVENASFMPWLTATAFLHSIMIQGRRGLLKNWNMILVSLTFLLSVFGTFLTRSGVVSSVHSFAESNIGGYFLGFLSLSLIFCFVLIVWRRDELTSDASFDSMLSREGAFLLSNALLVSAAFAVLWGTVYPAVSEAIFGQTVAVQQSYFNRVMAPIGLALLALAGIGPLLAWRRSSAANLLRTLRGPLVAALMAAPLLWWLSRWHTGAATAFTLCVLLAFAIGQEFLRGARARHNMTGEALPQALGNLLLKNRRRYGGYIVHLGLAVLFIGLTGSSVFKIELEPIELKPQETMRVGEYTLRFEGLASAQSLAPEKVSDVAARMTVLRDGRNVGLLEPNIDVYKAPGAADPEAMASEPGQQARRPAIMSNLAHDLYLALIGYDTTTGVATIKAYLNPLVMWIWISVAFFIGGTMIAMWPEPRRARVLDVATASVPRTETPRVARPVAPQPVVAATATQEKAL